MDRLALVLAILALLLGGVSYWRSGGMEDVAYARQEVGATVEQLEAKQKELVELASASMRSVYERSQQRMQQLNDSITESRKGAGEALTRQLNQATEQLDKLQRRVADAMETAKESTIASARNTQDLLMKQVARMDARVSILEARWNIDRAVARAEDGDFEAAESKLEEAVVELREARAKLAEDREFDAELDALRNSLQEAVAAVKSKAQDYRARIEQVVDDTDRLVAAFDEQAAGEQRK